MPTAAPITPRSVLGHVKLRRRKPRPTWYAKWRDADGVHHEQLGLTWEDDGAPPAGYPRRKEADAALLELLVEARCSATAPRQLAPSAGGRSRSPRPS